MGCWNGTCGISHLPIFSGEPIRLCLIVGHTYKLADDNLVRTPGTWKPDKEPEWVDDAGGRHEYPDQERTRTIDPAAHNRNDRNDRWREGWYSGFSYSHDIFFPRCVPLKGVYDDYGGIEKIENSANFTAIHDQFQLDLDEYPAGRFDIPVEIKRGMPLEGSDGLLRAIERGGVTVNRFKDSRSHSRASHLPVATWLVREDIYQAILKTKIIGRWSDGPFDIQQFYDGAEQYRLELIEEASKPSVEDLLKELGAKSEDRYSMLREAMRRGSNNPLVRSMQAPPFENGLGFYDDWLLDNIRKKKLDPESDKVKSLLKEIAEFSFFCIAKEIMRVAWMPQCGAGSQDERMDVHAAVAKQVLHTIELKRAEWAKEDAEDE